MLLYAFLGLFWLVYNVSAQVFDTESIYTTKSPDSIDYLPSFESEIEMESEKYMSIGHDESFFKEYDEYPLLDADMELDGVSLTPQCYSFAYNTSTELLQSTCANAVDYAFYIPAGYSLSFFENKARALLNNTKFTILPNQCQVSLKKLICSNIYLKCPKGIQIGVPSTYNFKIYSDIKRLVPIPFERPCQSLCTDVNTKCLGLLGLFSLSQNCSAKYDYSSNTVPIKPYQYDKGNNGSICNAMTKTFTIGLAKEPYVGGTSGACYGIVDYLYVPPASVVSSSLAPLSPSYAIQGILEKTLLSKFSVLPPFLSESCYFAIKKYFCRSVMIRAMGVTFNTAFTKAGVTPYLALLTKSGVNVTTLLTETVYIPSYPSYEVCENYQTTCSAFITKANKASLVPNCTKTTTTSTNVQVDSYPTGNQTIIVLPLKLSPVKTIDVTFVSTPDSVSYASESDYTTSCPQGFAVPDDPNDSRNRYVDGTGCAAVCRLPILTDAEFDRINTLLSTLAYLSIGSTLLVLAIWLNDSKRKHQHLVIIFAFFSFVTSVSFATMDFFPHESLYCASNTVGIDSTDPIGVCAITSFITAYGVLATSNAWAIQAVDVNLKIVWGKKTESHRNIHIAIILGLPCISIILMGALGLWGYTGGPKVCIFSTKILQNNYDFYVFFTPLMINTLIGLISMTWVIYEIIKVTRRAASVYPITQNSNDNNNSSNMNKLRKQNSKIVSTNSSNKSDDTEAVSSSSVRYIKISKAYTKFLPFLSKYLPKVSEDTMKKLRTPLIFFTIFFVFWLLIFAYRGIAAVNFNKYIDSFQDWAQCAFEYYDGKTQDWTNQCGTHPHYRESYGLSVIYYSFQSGQGILMSSIYLLNPNIWSLVLNKSIDFFVRLFTCNQKNGHDMDSFVQKSMQLAKHNSLIQMKNRDPNRLSSVNSHNNVKPHSGSEAISGRQHKSDARNNKQSIPLHEQQGILAGADSQIEFAPDEVIIHKDIEDKYDNDVESGDTMNMNKTNKNTNVTTAAVSIAQSNATSARTLVEADNEVIEVNRV